jgi:small multidrug resistance pump
MIAIVFEIARITCMKLSEELTKLVPSILIFVLYGLCLTFLTLSLRKLEVSIVYAFWSGLGTIVVTSIGIVWFRESLYTYKSYVHLFKNYRGN